MVKATQKIKIFKPMFFIWCGQASSDASPGQDAILWVVRNYPRALVSIGIEWNEK